MKRFFILFPLLTLAFFVASAQGDREAPAEFSAGAEDHTAPISVPDQLVDGQWLEGELGASNLVILDTARKSEDFISGHVAGALFADRSAYWAEVDGIPGMFPGVKPVSKWLEGLGISNDSAVVIYDAGSGLWAARVAWTLAYLGHDNWAVLNGGYALWEEDGRLIETGESPKIAAGSFVPSVRDELLISSDGILERMEDPDFVVVDTRSEGEYNGTDVRAARGGHIPGALFLEWTLNNSPGAIPEFLGTEELAEFYASEGVTDDKSVVTHCQTGVRGAHTWLALTLAGYDDVALYDGSWAEWAANDAYPVVQ